MNEEYNLHRFDARAPLSVALAHYPKGLRHYLVEALEGAEVWLSAGAAKLKRNGATIVYHYQRRYDESVAHTADLMDKALAAEEAFQDVWHAVPSDAAQDVPPEGDALPEKSDAAQEFKGCVHGDDIKELVGKHCVGPVEAVIFPAKDSEGFDLERAKEDNPYVRTIKGVEVDLYDIFEAYGVTYTVGHAVKKLMCLGKRSGGKSPEQDLKEAIWTLERALRIMKEGQ